MFKKCTLAILALISSPALDLFGKPMSPCDIKVTKADVMPDSHLSFAASGFTLAFVNALARSSLDDYKPNHYKNLAVFALDTAMIGAFLAAIVKDHKQDRIANTTSFLTGALVGTAAPSMPMVGAYLSAVPTAMVGGAAGGTIGTAAKMLNKKFKIPVIDCADFGAKIGLMTGGAIGGAAGLTASGAMTTAALYKNTSDLNQLIKTNLDKYFF